MIQFVDVGKKFWDGHFLRTILENVNLRIREGEMISITGESGCGKTTLLSLIGLLDNPTSGEILLEGKALSHMKGEELENWRGNNIGYLTQSNYLVPFFTVIENVKIPLILKGINKNEADFLAKSSLESVQIPKRVFESYPNKLSGGEKQRVAIARVLALKPRLLLADEPTGNLDEENADAIFKNLETINRDGVGVIIVTHDKKMAGKCPRQFVIEKGIQYENSI